MDPGIESRVAIVTGSSSGLGRCTSLMLADQGVSVVCADLTPIARPEIPQETEVETHELIQQRGGRAIYVKTDVSVASDMEALVKSAVEWGGRLDMSVFPLSYLSQDYHLAIIHLFFLFLFFRTECLMSILR